MKRLAYIGLVMIWSFASCVACAVASAGEAQTVIFAAMRDELERSVYQLEMEDLGRPYFVSYTVDDVQELQTKASLGTLIKSELVRSRFVTVDLRVGGSRLDNSNFHPGYSIRGPDYFRIPIEDDYDAIRNRIYLGTDKAYKKALKTLSSKEAYLQTRLIKDRPDDLIEQEAHRVLGRPEDFDIDQAYFDELIRAASGVFRDYPMIVSSELRLTGGVINQYFVNSNGTTAMRGDRIYSITVTMNGKGPDGDDVGCDDRIIVSNLEDLPDPDGLVRWVRTNADEMTALIAAETIDGYSGPVIFVDDAAGGFFQQLFAQEISNIPPPLFEEEGMGGSYHSPELANRVGRRVLPAFMDVYDDPTIDHLGNLKLIGAYEIDDAGGLPQRIEIVEKGKLVGLPIGTAPTKKLKESNGHARGAVSRAVNGKPANLVIESSDKVSLEKLKEAMLELCRDFDLEYGLVIRGLADPDAPHYGMFFGGGSSSDMELGDPVRVYKVFPDGREEPVRSLEFTNITIRALRDILQTGNKQYVHNYFVRNDYEMPVSIVCPAAILIEEMELKEREVKPRKPPILPSPLLEQD